jgi:phosphomannomutase
LTDLASVVAKEKADIGIAVDPDVDRLVLIDEKGKPIGEEYSIAAVVKFVLSHTPRAHLQRPVVINLSTTRAVEDIAASYNTPVIRTPVGEINVAKKMRDVNALIGGEGSGGIIHPALHYGRDAIAGIVVILQYLAESETPLSQLKASLPQYEIVKSKIELKESHPDNILRTIAATVDGDAKLNTDDGVRLDYPDYWVHFRKSNTEPIIRVIVESTSREDAMKVVHKYREEILRLM